MKKKGPTARVVGPRVCPNCGHKYYLTIRYDGFANVYRCQNCHHEFRKQIDYR